MVNEKILQTRISLKIDTLENWKSSSLILRNGEIALATVAAEAGTSLQEPVVMLKVGDGEKTFSQLGWNFYAKAADVLAACKDEQALKTFINGVIADAGIATNDAMEALAGRVTTAEGKIVTLEGNIATLNGEGEGSVAKKIADAIAALKLGETYEVKGEAAKVQGELNTYKQANDIALAGVKATAEAAYVKPVGGITTADLSAGVVASLGKADTALQEHQNISHLAVKSEVETELGKKVDKTVYEGKVGELEGAIGGKVDKVEGKSLISDSEITRLAGVHNYDDTQVKADIAKKADSATMTTELGKKVDKVEGHSLISDSEIARLKDVHNYDDSELRTEIGKKADSELMTTELGKKVDKVEGYSLVSDTEITRLSKVDNYNDAEVRGLIGDNADAIGALAGKVGDVPQGQTVMGIITNIQENAYDDTELRGLISDNSNAIAQKVAQSDYDVKVKALEDAIALKQDIIPANTYDAYGAASTAESNAKGYVDSKFEQANLAQYTTEEEVKSIVDGVITAAVDGDAIDGLTELVQYINTHGGEASEMATAIGVLEGKVGTIEGKPAYGILATDIAAWNGEIGAKALAETKTTAAEVKTQIEAYGYATEADLTLAEGRISVLEGIDHDAYKGADEVVLKGAKDYADGLNTAMNGRVEALEAIDHEHGNKSVLDGISAAKVEAWDKSEQNAKDYSDGKLAEAKTAISAEIDADVKVVNDALEAYKTANNTEVAKKANDADLKPVAKSGLIDDLSIGEGTILIFDCGDSKN